MCVCSPQTKNNRGSGRVHFHAKKKSGENETCLLFHSNKKGGEERNTSEVDATAPKSATAAHVFCTPLSSSCLFAVSPTSWYAVGFDRDIVAGPKPFGVSIFDEPLVLFRDNSGAIQCVSDVCPHRAAKLSEGQVRLRGWRTRAARSLRSQERYRPPSWAAKWAMVGSLIQSIEPVVIGLFHNVGAIQPLSACVQHSAWCPDLVAFGPRVTSHSEIITVRYKFIQVHLLTENIFFTQYSCSGHGGG